jgi:hypothetical protein
MTGEQTVGGGLQGMTGEQTVGGGLQGMTLQLHYWLVGTWFLIEDLFNCSGW